LRAEHELKALLDFLVGSGRAERGSPEHRRVQVHGGDREARLGERDRETAGPGHQLQDRAPRLLGQREPEVQVPGIVKQVQVVETRERVRELLRFGCLRHVGHAGRVPRPAKLTGVPAACLAASAAIASIAHRLAAIAVTSAWSYGGETSTMSIPASSTAPTIRRMARSNSRVSMPPGSGVPVPGAIPGSITSMSTER
jgi:hypothetical protein